MSTVGMTMAAFISALLLFSLVLYWALCTMPGLHGHHTFTRLATMPGAGATLALFGRCPQK